MRYEFCYTGPLDKGYTPMGVSFIRDKWLPCSNDQKKALENQANFKVREVEKNDRKSSRTR